MKINRTQNTVNNVIWGSINKIVTMLGPFLVQTTIIRILGMEYNGLTGLFSSILNVLNLAELGLGTAIVFSMYKAVATDDEVLIRALLSFYRKVYHVIGAIVLCLGLIAVLVLKIICPEELPGGLNIYVIYLICLSNVVLSYNLFAYQQAILNAFQQTSIIDKFKTAVNCLLYVIQIVLLMLLKNYYFYVVTLPIQTVLTNALLYWKSRKLYPNLIPAGEINNNERRQILDKTKALFFYKIGGTVLVSVDSIVISAVLGLHVLGQYNSYYYIVNALSGFIIILFNSMTAGIGNSIVVESVEKNHKDFTVMFFLHRWVMGWMTTTLLCLYEPFMKMWIGVEEMLPFSMAICFVIYFYFMQIGNVLNVYRDAGGLWEYDKWRPLIAAGVNLVLNISFVSAIGIYAIILSTIISILLIILPWSTYITFKQYFKNGLKDYFVMLIQGVLFTGIISVLTYFICSLIDVNGVIGLIIKLIIATLFSNILYYIVFAKTKYYKTAKSWIMGKIKDQ